MVLEKAMKMQLNNLMRTTFLLWLLHSVNGQTTVQFCGNTPADVVFLLDSSNSMWGPDFKEQLEFVINVTRMFQIGENATQVALVTFNDNVQPQFSLNEYRDKRMLLNAIRQVEQTYGYSTATDQALKYLRTRVFQTRNGARHGVPHIAVVITDGQSDQTLKTLIEATKAKRHNIIIFTIGVGKGINRLELERMASTPSNEHAFAVDGFSFLNSIKEKLAIQTCMVTAPPTQAMTVRPTMITTALKVTKTTESQMTPETTRKTDPATTTTTAEPTTPTTTTTEGLTTTTIPMSTTTSWVDIVRKICDKKMVDVVFAMDSSDGVSYNDFWYQIKFVRDFTLGLDVGFNKTRIGIVVYSDKVSQVFDINDHTSMSSAINHLYGINRTDGGSQIDKVINHVRTKSFRRAITRRESAQLLVLITSSSSENLHSVKKEANKARNTGVDIMVIGVGDKVNTEELSIIAGVDNFSHEKVADDFSPFLESSSVRRRQIFHTKSFSELETIVMEATIEACTSEAALIPVSDQACGDRQKADMMFVMDSASAGKKNTKKSLDFIKHVADAMVVSEDAVQIGMIQPEDCIPKSESFRLNSHSEKNNVLSALDRPVQDDKLSSLLKNMRKDAFKKKKGGRDEAKKIAVILVDGDLQHPLKVLKEARRAQVNGIEVYVIFVGRDPPQPEVRDMCAYPPDKHFFQVADYDRLKDLEDSLIDILCDEL